MTTDIVIKKVSPSLIQWVKYLTKKSTIKYSFSSLCSISNSGLILDIKGIAYFDNLISCFNKVGGLTRDRLKKNGQNQCCRGWDFLTFSSLYGSNSKTTRSNTNPIMLFDSTPVTQALYSIHLLESCLKFVMNYSIHIIFRGKSNYINNCSTKKQLDTCNMTSALSTALCHWITAQLLHIPSMYLTGKKKKMRHWSLN